MYKFYGYYYSSSKFSSEYIEADQQNLDTIEITKLNEYNRKISFIALN